eukprot:322677-Alexandrium_andersonii.AAC.1
MGSPTFRRFGAAERAAWRVGPAGTAALSGWTWGGPELTLTRHLSGRLGAPTYKDYTMRHCL